MLFSHPSVKAITWWDLSDRNAWRNAPAGLIRKDMAPKPAYERLMNLVHGKWWTKVKGATNAAGQFKSRVFRGIQRVTIAVGKKAPIVRQVVVTGAGEQTFIVKI